MIVIVFLTAIFFFPTTELLFNSVNTDNRTVTNSIPAPSTTDPSTKITRVTTITDHDPIVIADDGMWFYQESGVTSGSGSENDPFIISNWFIDGNGVSDCIMIENTVSHFIIENCILVGATGSGRCGIDLFNVENGQLRNNECNTSQYGIRIEYSSNIILKNNTCNSNERSGIVIRDSPSTTLNNNTCNSNVDGGIQLGSKSPSSTLTNNTCNSNQFGIIVTSDYCTLNSNDCNNNTDTGIYVGGSDYCTLSSNTCDNNTNLGINVYNFCEYTTLNNNTCYNSL